MSKIQQNSLESMRLDKWLWCTRFYKTRALAASAIKNGNVEIGGLKAKPSRLVKLDDEIVLRRNPYIFELAVKALANSRASAAHAALLYRESDASISKRESIASQLKLTAAASGQTTGRPDKQQRRRIIRFTRQGD